MLSYYRLRPQLADGQAVLHFLFGPARFPEDETTCDDEDNRPEHGYCLQGLHKNAAKENGETYETDDTAGDERPPLRLVGENGR